MAKRNDPPTADDGEHNTTPTTGVSRRRLLQLSGVGLAIGTAGAAGVSANTSELPHSIIIDGSGSTETAAYEFLVSGSVAAHPDRGSNDSASGSGGHVTNSLTTETHAYQFSGALSYLDVDGTAEVTLLYGDDEPASTDRLQLVAGSDATIDYEITSDDTVTKVVDAGDRSANEGDTITETDDSWLVEGSTENGAGDTYDLAGSVKSIDPVAGDFTVFFNGEETTVTELTGQEADTDDTEVNRDHWYSVEPTGDSFVDYYIEVEEGGEMVASTVDDAIIEPDFHWLNEDGTKAAGRVQAGDTHAVAFDTTVLDVTIEGEAAATVDGNPSDLDYYPREGATGDHWKGYFPWQIDGEERTHWYSVAATGEEYVDYYIEVDDGGAMIPSTVDDAVIDYEFFWIGDGGTKAAGRVQAGDTHAFAFDTGLLDVTVDGDAAATVNGNDSDLDWYPRDGATGDSWKRGFPWQDDGDGVSTTEPSGDGTLGGGAGYANTVSQSAADYVVRSHGEFVDGLSAAGAGDVVYVAGGSSIELGDRTYDVDDGVTLASDRGIDGAAGGLLHTDEEPSKLLDLKDDARLTGIQLRGPHPGDDTSGDYAHGVQLHGASEVDNCEVWGFAYAGIDVDEGDGAYIHHNVIRENNKSGLGYGVSASSGTPVIEYNYFNYNRHSVASGGDNPGYICRYNHFGPTEVMHNIDAHDPAGDRYEIHNNVVETVRREWDDNLNHAVDIRGVPDDLATIYDNWFFNDNAPDPNGSPDSGGQTIVQEGVSEWTNVEFGDNAYGEDANVSYSDIIPGYDGWRS
ncbi:right-handed parallel beta-helix repeat-containing protein [Halonotius roseus]|uniref:Right-handed parallel beta-helix repeat-containing protein n=1 Tax=Halonotius roseus TaxID=2511997 RepID=A0A544QMY9_9EURY|nr:right-handed parallel beta-helix repeat-containing protein [Halonotius roseus]TQQ80250.1 right-handed parallel beta-helix repeat-containing protein [Halonotius roseus]